MQEIIVVEYCNSKTENTKIVLYYRIDSLTKIIQLDFENSKKYWNAYLYPLAGTNLVSIPLSFKESSDMFIPPCSGGTGGAVSRSISSGISTTLVAPVAVSTVYMECPSS